MEQKQESLRKLLNKIAKEHKYENHKIIINEISSGGANYTSTLFTVIIREENKQDLHLFAKISAFGEELRKEMPVDFYDTERFAYTKLVKMYASLEEENGVPEEHRLFFTKCYGFDVSKNQDILVLENLLALRYGTHDRFASFDWKYASTAVTNLAKMHALSFAFSKSYPEEFEKDSEALKYNWKESENMDNVAKNTVNLALENVNPENRDALEKFVENKPPPFKMTGPIRKTVIIHGDFRGNNLLHRVREEPATLPRYINPIVNFFGRIGCRRNDLSKDGKLEIKILDLQTLQPGSPASDLLYFIFTGSDEEFRAKYYEKLLDHYYTQLSAAMKRLNLDPEETYSREDFDYEIKEKMPYGLMVAVFLLPLVTVDSENAPEINESAEPSAFSVNKTGDLYPERLNGVVNDFVKWGILK